MKFFAILTELLSGLKGLAAVGQKKLTQVLTGMVLVLAGAAVVLTLVLSAAGMLLFGLFQYLTEHLSLPFPALIVSATALLMAGLVIGLLKWKISVRARH